MSALTDAQDHRCRELAEMTKPEHIRQFAHLVVLDSAQGLPPGVTVDTIILGATPEHAKTNAAVSRAMVVSVVAGAAMAHAKTRTDLRRGGFVSVGLWFALTFCAGLLCGGWFA